MGIYAEITRTRMEMGVGGGLTQGVSPPRKILQASCHQEAGVGRKVIESVLHRDIQKTGS